MARLSRGSRASRAMTIFQPPAPAGRALAALPPRLPATATPPRRAGGGAGSAPRMGPQDPPVVSRGPAAGGTGKERARRVPLTGAVGVAAASGSSAPGAGARSPPPPPPPAGPQWLGLGLGGSPESGLSRTPSPFFFVSTSSGTSCRFSRPTMAARGGGRRDRGRARGADAGRGRCPPADRVWPPPRPGPPPPPPRPPRPPAGPPRTAEPRGRAPGAAALPRRAARRPARPERGSQRGGRRAGLPGVPSGPTTPQPPPLQVDASPRGPGRSRCLRPGVWEGAQQSRRTQRANNWKLLIVNALRMALAAHRLCRAGSGRLWLRLLPRGKRGCSLPAPGTPAGTSLPGWAAQMDKQCTHLADRDLRGDRAPQGSLGRPQFSALQTGVRVGGVSPPFYLTEIPYLSGNWFQ